MRKPWSIAIYVFLTFASGLAVGAMGHRYYSTSAESSHKSRGGPDGMRTRIRNEFLTRLKLDDKQVPELDKAMEATKADWDAFRSRHKAEVDELRLASDRRFQSFLRPDQLVEFEKMKEEREKKFRGGPPMPPPAEGSK